MKKIMTIFTYCIRTITSKDSPPKWSPSINKHFVKFTLHKNRIIVTGPFGWILFFLWNWLLNCINFSKLIFCKEFLKSIHRINTQCMKQLIFPSTLICLSVFSSSYCHYTEHFYLMNLIWWISNCWILNYFYRLVYLLSKICRLKI